jgi:hypothetical protein
MAGVKTMRGPIRDALHRPNARRRTAYAAFVWVLGFFGWHAVWFLTGSKAPEASVHHGAARVAFYAASGVMYLMAVVGAVLPLALAQAWGARIPRRLLLVTAWAGAILLAVRGFSGILDDVLRVTGVMPKGLTGLTMAQALGSAQPSFWEVFAATATDFIFAVGGMLFGLAALAYERADDERGRASANQWKTMA